jgi:hypothetical protein
MANLTLVYNAWDCLELLRPSIENLRPVVDDVIIVWSKMSNRGNIGTFDPADYPDCILVNYEPTVSKGPHYNERFKRQLGLDGAKKRGFSHFLMMDCDEFYEPEPFKKEYSRIVDSDLNGLICALNVYFREPTLTIGRDPATRVPFIHKILPHLQYRTNKSYPFAYDENGARIDPTRQLNIDKRLEWSDNIVMDHLSWVREDIMSKINNSSANLKGNKMILEDYENAKEGYFVKMYGRTLVRCENKYNL